MTVYYADIIVDISQEKLDRTFQYRIPKALEHKIRAGDRVVVPFGSGGRKIRGYVIGISNEPNYPVEKIKEIHRVEEGELSIESRLISLAAWMREQYGSTMNQALKTVLPIKKRVKAKESRRILLQLSQGEGRQLLAEWERKHYTARARLLQALLAQGSLDYAYAVKELQVTPSVIKGLEEKQVVSVESTTIYRNPMVEIEEKAEKICLNEEQQQAADAIFREWGQKNRPCLLHGVTGSGKTEVYMTLIESVLEQGQQVIVLIPEIALTYQTLRRFYSRFGKRVSVMNSRLSAGERYDQFEQAKTGKIKIMIGPRSALFTPFSDLGLIIIDEEQENSYKSENVPRYHARETAIKRAQMEGAHVVMGSATPSVEAYYRAAAGDYQIVTLKKRYRKQKLPQVYIADLREELKAGNRSILSGLLEEKIQDRLKKKEQVMLFLNRRGYAGFVSCRACGYVVKCPHCDVSMVEHQGGRLVCHYCGYETVQVKRCPQCGSSFIGGFKAGTQQIETLMKKKFPTARILRMDLDTTRNKNAHADILGAFARGEADILIGTQMIIKGHDFPRVTLVGVLAADLSLHAGDFRASEKTFQILCQAAGRAGRGTLPGEAVIQTYHPEHYSIEAAVGQDYEAFYQQEITYRMLMGYPPVSCMEAIYGSCEDEGLLDMAMGYMKEFVQKIYPHKDLFVIGPAPEAVAKVNDQYRRVLYLRHGQKQVLIRIKDAVERYIEINAGFKKIGIQFDIEG